MNGRFIRAAAGAMTDGRFINLVQGTLSVQGGTFISNTTATSSTFSATLSVTGAGFTNNAGREGGAIYDYDSLTATDSVFTANHATQGGVVDQEWYATLTGDLFTGNTATASGGDMYAGYQLRGDGHRDGRHWTARERGPFRAVVTRAEAPRRSSPPAPAAGTDRPVAAEGTRGPGSPPGTWPPAKVAGCYTPRSASRRPELMAAVKAWKSCSFWSAYAAAKSAIALSNAADPPR
jgi:hypothetical protein